MFRSLIILGTVSYGVSRVEMKCSKIRNQNLCDYEKLERQIT